MSAAHGMLVLNSRTLGKLVVVAGVMFGFGYAMVPFYQAICRAAGLNNLGAPDAVAAVGNTQVDFARQVSIELDANTHNMAWRFKPLQPHLAVHPGELATVVFEVRNQLDRPVTGQAIPSYSPAAASQYFRKLDCFCFAKQTLAPGEVRQMPVAFVVDGALPAEVNTITLSYTFFEVAGTAPAGG